MADLPAISDANLYAAKSDDIAVPGGEETTHIGAADLNAIRARMSENRTQANTALSTAEAAQATADGALPAPGGTTTNGGIVVGSGTSGDAVAVSTTTVASLQGAISAAQTDATQALADAAAAQLDADNAQSDAADALAATTHLTIREETTNTVVGGGQAGERLLMRVSGSDLIVTLADTATAGQRSEVVRTFAPGADPGGDVIIQGVDGDHIITGPTRIGRKGGKLDVSLLGIDGSTYYWLITGPPMPRAPATHTSATLTLAEGDRDNVIRVSAASNAVAVEIPDTLPGADSGTSDVWECQIDIVDGTTNAVTISTGAGLLTPEYMGSLNAITVDGTKVAIQVVRGVASVIIVEPYTP